MPSSGYFSVLIRKLIYPVLSFVGRTGLVLLIVFLAFVFYAFFKYGINPFRLEPMQVQRLRKMRVKLKVLDFFRWKLVDHVALEDPDEFKEYGLTVFCGRQGAGKTISLVSYGRDIRRRYPNCIVVANFACSFAHHRMESWQDFFDIRNGTDGVLFLIDEIQSEFSSMTWKDFPEEMLAEISQQRKQRVKIAATSQVFTRIAKPIREQCNSVVQCTTVGGRWTFNKEYDALDYELFCDSPSRKQKLRPFRKRSFVQSDTLRNCFDTYEKILRMKEKGFLPRSERGAG